MPDLERTLAKEIKAIDQSFRVILVTGQRQVGKSTLLKNMAVGTDRRYVTLDDMSMRKLAQTDPKLFLQQFSPPVIIDEIQYAPDLFSYIKIYADENREHKGAFWLTGSHKYNLMTGITESLAGRVCIMDLYGLSYREKIEQPFSSKPFVPSMEQVSDDQKLTMADVYHYIWQGSMPEYVLEMQSQREHFFSSYIKTFIERDVRDFNKIEKPLQFFDFLTAVAAQTGRYLNYTSLARDVGIDVKTAQKWMGILERSGIVYLLRPYSTNITRRIIKMPKMYFLDTGLCSYLTKWPNSETLMSGSMSGQILETYVIGEILKSYHHNGKEPTMYHYRENDQHEIDLIIAQNSTLHPIEIKRTANPSIDATKSFKLLNKLGMKVGLGAVICLQPERIPLSQEVVSVPVWEI